MAEVRTYKGSTPQDAMAAFQADIETMALGGFEPGSQTETKEVRRLRPDLYVLTVEWEPETPWTGIRFYSNGSIRIQVESPEQAKNAIKLVRQRKKEVALEKKELTAQASAIRAHNRGRTSQGPVAQRLTQIAQQKAMIDAKQVELDRAMLRVEDFLAQHPT